MLSYYPNTSPEHGTLINRLLSFGFSHGTVRGIVLGGFGEFLPIATGIISAISLLKSKQPFSSTSSIFHFRKQNHYFQDELCHTGVSSRGWSRLLLNHRRTALGTYRVGS